MGAPTYHEHAENVRESRAPCRLPVPAAFNELLYILRMQGGDQGEPGATSGDGVLDRFLRPAPRNDRDVRGTYERMNGWLPRPDGRRHRSDTFTYM